jgi:hypothetical protein
MEPGSESTSTSTSTSRSTTEQQSDQQQQPEEVLPLFVPCPNRQQAMQTIGVGENRDKFILKPSSNSPEHLRMFEFLGKLMGIAGTPLPRTYYHGHHHKTRELIAFHTCSQQFTTELLCAARTKSILSLNLPALFWKPLVGVEPTLQDLKAIDYSTMESLQRMTEMDQDLFQASILENFTTSLSDKTIVRLPSAPLPSCACARLCAAAHLRAHAG